METMKEQIAKVEEMGRKIHEILFDGKTEIEPADMVNAMGTLGYVTGHVVADLSKFGGFDLDEAMKMITYAIRMAANGHLENQGSVDESEEE